MALGDAVKHGMLNRNVAALVDLPRNQPHAMGAWGSSEARAFLEGTANDPLAAAWALFATRGPRRAEVAGLKWDAIDLDSKRMRVVGTLVMVNGKPTVSAPKTAAGRRVVPLDDRVGGTALRPPGKHQGRRASCRRTGVAGLGIRVHQRPGSA
jgi:integrase